VTIIIYIILYTSHTLIYYIKYKWRDKYIYMYKHVICTSRFGVAVSVYFFPLKTYINKRSNALFRRVCVWWGGGGVQRRRPDSVSVSDLIRKCCAHVAPFSYPLRAAAAAMSGLSVRASTSRAIAPLMTCLPARATIASTYIQWR